MSCDKHILLGPLSCKAVQQIIMSLNYLFVCFVQRRAHDSIKETAKPMKQKKLESMWKQPA